MIPGLKSPPVILNLFTALSCLFFNTTAKKLGCEKTVVNSATEISLARPAAKTRASKSGRSTAHGSPLRTPDARRPDETQSTARLRENRRAPPAARTRDDRGAPRRTTVADAAAAAQGTET